METSLRVIIAYAFIWAAFRVLGKRELSRMSPLELVLLLFIPQLFSRALTRQDYSFTNAIIGASTLLALTFLTSAMTYRSKRVASVMVSKPTVLVAHGELLTEELDHERMSPNDIFDAMQKAGVTTLDEVEWAVLQSDGAIAIVRRDHGRVSGVARTKHGGT